MNNSVSCMGFGSALFFSSSQSKEWFEFVINNWKPKARNIVLVPCASKKPFYRSVTHNSFLRPFWELWHDGRIGLVIISEPLTVVPAEYDYPFPQYPLYEYPPKLIMRHDKYFERERKIWRRRIKKFLEYIRGNNIFYILYPYHKKIFGKLLDKYGAQGYYVERIYLAKKARLIAGRIGFKNDQKNITITPMQQVC